MGRKNKRVPTSGERIKTEQEMRQAKKKLRQWQVDIGHVRQVFAGFASGRKLKGGF